MEYLKKNTTVFLKNLKFAEEITDKDYKNKIENLLNNKEYKDETLTRKYSGIGLGLYISKQLLTLLGGEIWLESVEENPSEGKAGGTTFYFSIPR